MGKRIVKIHPDDNVAVALIEIPANTSLKMDCGEYTARETIPQGHKMALRSIDLNENITKYGCSIGHAVQKIYPGSHVHTHNMATNLSEKTTYAYQLAKCVLPKMEKQSFKGFRRKDGRAAIRNEIWVIPLVGCVNSIAMTLVQNNQHLVGGNVEGIYTFPHPFGCSQMSDDHTRTRRLLAALVNHPNAAAVLVLGLGCENNTLQEFQKELGSWDHERVRFLICQECEDEVAEAATMLGQLADYARQFERVDIGADELVIGLKCGGSDGLSGITANPAVGRFSDLLIAQGGTSILTEVPEMFGAESLLMNRCRNEDVFRRAVGMIEDFKDYFTSHGQVVYENPSPGNKAGGITTLEDKSCGCVQKGGSAYIEDVLAYGEEVRTRGLILLSGPGNDMVSTTVMAAAGAHMVLFTTGRGTPFGSPVPTVKIATNTNLARQKAHWIDFNAGTIAEGETVDAVGERLMKFVIEISSGKQTCTEKMGYREISIFKDGVVL